MISRKISCDNCGTSGASITASENKEELDVITFVSRHIPRAFKDTKTNVRAAVCGVLANVHVSLWCRLENNIREMFFQEILSKCKVVAQFRMGRGRGEAESISG